jgi:hypothetical protein
MNSSKAGNPRGRSTAARLFWPAVALLTAIYLALNVGSILPGLGTQFSDFAFYQGAGRAILEGKSPFTVPAHDYPPLLSFLVAPFAALSYHDARLLWFILSQLLIAISGLWVWRALGGRRRDLLNVGIAWTTAGAIAITLREGQADALLLPLLCIAFWPPPGARPRRAWAIGFATALKLWPGVLIVGDLLRRRLGDALRAAAVALVLLAVPLGTIATLLHGRVFPAHAAYWMGTPAALNGSLPAVVLRVLDPPHRGERLPVNWLGGDSALSLHLRPSYKIASVAVAVATLLCGIALIRRALHREGGMRDTAAVDASLVALWLLASPIAWAHYQLFQLPGAARLGRDLVEGRRWGRLGLLAAAFVIANWTEAVVRGPYLAHYGTVAVSLALVWLLTTAPMVACGALFGLHLDWLSGGGSRSRDG